MPPAKPCGGRVSARITEPAAMILATSLLAASVTTIVIAVVRTHEAALIITLATIVVIVIAKTATPALWFPEPAASTRLTTPHAALVMILVTSMPTVVIIRRESATFIALAIIRIAITSEAIFVAPPPETFVWTSVFVTPVVAALATTVVFRRAIALFVIAALAVVAAPFFAFRETALIVTRPIITSCKSVLIPVPAATRSIPEPSFRIPIAIVWTWHHVLLSSWSFWSSNFRSGKIHAGDV
jgi:hypothetical protein